MGRPPKAPEERLVTLSVRVPHASLEMLDRIVEGEQAFLKARRLPIRGVNRSQAFRTIWELGELEYALQRVTLWVTRKTNRYTVEQAARLLGWSPTALAALLKERGVDAPEPAPPSPPAAQPPPDAPPPPKLDPSFLH